MLQPWFIIRQWDIGISTQTYVGYVYIFTYFNAPDRTYSICRDHVCISVCFYGIRYSLEVWYVFDYILDEDDIRDFVKSTTTLQYPQVLFITFEMKCWVSY